MLFEIEVSGSDQDGEPEPDRGRVTGSPGEAAASGWDGPNTGRVLILIASLLVLPVVAMANPAVAQGRTDRPRVGLALGGGSARGLAHVGVLEWLEEHRIPIDAIAGTSMGGLVGGSYAAGLTSLEVRDMVAEIPLSLRTSSGGSTVRV